MKHYAIATLLALLLAGCATKQEVPPPEPVRAVEPAPQVEEPKEAPSSPKGAESMSKGLNAYENGAYKTSRKHLLNALKSELNQTDQINANKHLAFMACSSGQKVSCKSYFRKVLALDPNFELGEKEAGNPVWSKTFQAAKKEQKK